MNERLAQLQLRYAVLYAEANGLSAARQAALKLITQFRATLAHVAKLDARPDELERLAQSGLSIAGIDRGDLIRAAKDVRLCVAIEAEQKRLTAEMDPLRTLIERITKEMPTHEQWTAAS